MHENSQIIGLELAKLAREKGFNEICDHAYCFDIDQQSYYVNYDHDYFYNGRLFEKHYAAPKRETLNEWLRMKGVFITLEVDQTFEPKFAYSIATYFNTSQGWTWSNHDPSGTTLFYKYEYALENALEEALKLL